MLTLLQVYYDFESKHGWTDSSFAPHPEHFFVSSPVPKWKLRRAEKKRTFLLIFTDGRQNDR